MNTADDFLNLDPEPKTSTRKPLVFGIGAFIFLFIIVGGWLNLANISGAVIGQGIVAVQGKPKTLQQLEPGIVSEILIKEGDLVEKGALLVKLDDTLLQTNKEIYSSRLREAIARRARLVAERDELSDIVWEQDVLLAHKINADDQVNEGQINLLLARRSTREGQVSQLNERMAQYENQINGIRSLKSSKKAQLDLLEEDLVSVRALIERDFAARPQLTALEREKEELLGQSGEYDAELALTENLINETEIQILQVGREFQQSILSELREVEGEVNEASQLLYATLEQLERVEVRAPVSGIIHELNVVTIGGVISAGSPILQIIPQDEGYEVEVNIEPQFIDELFPEQIAALRFSAFNQRTTPELEGTVKTISPNIIVNPQTGISFYEIIIDLPAKQLARLNGQPLVPGMPVEAFIKTRERTPMNYLLKPLTDQIKRAFREE